MFIRDWGRNSFKRGQKQPRENSIAVIIHNAKRNSKMLFVYFFLFYLFFFFFEI